MAGTCLPQTFFSAEKAPGQSLASNAPHHVVRDARVEKPDMNISHSSAWGGADVSGLKGNAAEFLTDTITKQLVAIWTTSPVKTATN
jgi:hypothetical protein